MKKTLILGVAALILGFVLGWAVGARSLKFGGTTSLDSLALKGTLSVDGATTLTGAVTQSGALSLGSTLAVPAAATTLSSLSVTGTSSFTGVATFATASSSLSRVNGKDADDSVDFRGFSSSTVDANSLGSGGATTSLVTVTGASTGDTVEVGLTGSWAAPSSSVRVVGSVTAADTVTLYYVNTSSTAVNLTSAVYNVEVTSHP
jgi:hypothetical protein